ncbi:MAG: ABC transporter substrate-binding protein [Desulfomonilaceae bacterium]
MKRFSAINLALLGIVLLGSSAIVSNVCAEETVKIGVIYALSGPGSSLGTVQMDSAKLAIKDINDRGGVNIGGKKLKIEGIYHDDETKPDVAVRKVKSMIVGDKIAAVVGGTFAHVSMAINAQTRKTPVFFCATNGVPEEFFTRAEKGPYTCSMIPPTEALGAGSALYVTQKMKLKNIVLCLPDYAYGQGAHRGMERVFKEMPDVKYTTIWTPVGTADMTPYLIKAAEAKPDIVIMGQWGNDAINILKQAYEMGLHKQTKIFFNYIVNVFATGIPADALEGVMCQMYWYHDMTGFADPEVVKISNELSKKFQQAYNQPPDPYGMSAYMGVQEVVRAMELAKSTDSKKAYEALMTNPDWLGPKGPAKWMVDGNPRFKYSAFIGRGLGAAERKDPKWDYVKIVDFYSGELYQKPPEQLGW